MHFLNWKNASDFVEEFNTKLCNKVASVYVKGKDTPAPWRSVLESDKDGWWTKLCIDQEIVGGITHYVIYLQTWPDGALRNPKLTCTLEEVDHMEEVRV